MICSPENVYCPPENLPPENLPPENLSPEKLPPENVYYFKDRVPGVRAAGVLTRLPGESVQSCLTHPYPHEVYFVEGEKQVEEKTGAGRRPQRTVFDFRTQMAGILKPCTGHPLINEIADTVHNSWWKKPLGRRRHFPAPPPCSPYPEHLNHGVSTVPKEGVGDLVNPKHTKEELRRDECAKRLYKVSHDAFEPGEQIRRCYNSHFDIYQRFGLITPRLEDGTMVRRIMHWLHDAPVSMVTYRQADYVETNRAHLGRARGPECYPGRQASGQALFGLSDPDCVDHFEESASKKEQLSCMKHINTLRNNLKERVPSFPFADLYVYFKQLCSGCEYVHLQTLENECRKWRVFINKPIIQLMKNLGIVNQCNLVDYGRFINLINWQCTFPEMPNAFDPTDPSVFQSVYKLSMTGEPSSCDPERAGKPVNQYDVADPLPRSHLRADKDSLEYETDAVAVLNPSIFAHYGLDHTDFFKPRSMDEIRKLFCAIGVKLPKETFLKLWDEGCKLDSTGGVCIETFRNLLDKLACESMRM